MPAAKVGDINIYHEVHGRGEALVLIMGSGANCGWWFRQVPAFSQGYRVVAFDNRGAGGSDKPEIPYTMEMMTADLAGLLEAIGIKSAHIFGVSLGGMIAQYLALDYPQKVTSLILGCTSCGGPHSIQRSPEVAAALADFGRLQRLTPAEMAKEMLAVMVSQEFINKNPDLVEQYIAKHAEHVTPIQSFMRQRMATVGHDTYERLPEIKVPTLVIAGDADRLMPVENSQILASKIPNAELVILKNIGHGFWIEAADEVNKVVLDFLRRHRRGH